MELFGKLAGQHPLLIAEIGINHEGSLEEAKKLVRLAHESGADAVKLQSYTPARYASSSDPERLARVSRFALAREAHEELFALAQGIGCHLFSTPLTEDWVEKLSSHVSAFKVASGDLTFEPVVRACARSGKPLLLSTGASTLAEVSQAVQWVKDEMGSSGARDKLVLMHCVSAYPTPIDQANILAIPSLQREFGLKIGYSNHVLGPEASLAAVALGACVVEVHFTDRREGKEFRDHSLSFEPAELTQLKRAMNQIHLSLGSGTKELMACERSMIPAIRKGLIAWKEIKEGAILTREDVAFARPATYFASGELDRVLGSRVRKALSKGELLTPSHLSSNFSNET